MKISLKLKLNSLELSRMAGLHANALRVNGVAKYVKETGESGWPP